MESPIQFVHFIEANFILFLCQLFTIFIVLKLIVDKKAASNIIAWLLAILFIPYFAIPFFFIFQRKDSKSFWQKDDMEIKDRCIKKIANTEFKEKGLPIDVIKVFSSLNIPAPTSNNTFKIYTDGVESYNAFIDTIKDAKSTIYIQTYVFKNDTTSNLIINLLKQKATEGVKIKILIDSLGSFYTYRNQRRIFGKLKKLGVDIAFFMPVLSNPFRNYINFRNHRKIYIIDNQIAFSGGMNIGNEYMSPIEHEGMWEDLLFKVEGEALNYFLAVFFSDWRFTTKEELSIEAKYPTFLHENYMQVVPSGPDMQNNQLYSGLITAINSAKQKIWIVTPYLIPSQDLLQSIILARHRGIDVKIITPKKSNHRLVDRARTSYFREFLTNDVHIYFTEKMIHAKAIIIDDNLAMLGSVNLDNRSLFLNYEIATFIYSSKSVKKLSDWANKILLQSSENISHLPQKKSSLMVESIIKILTPLM